jgi:hypothetical protein
MCLLGRGDNLVGEPEPPLGSHIVTRRRSYLHYSIYVGARKVVHDSGFARGLRGGPVEEIPFLHFARGQRVWVRSDAGGQRGGLRLTELRRLQAGRKTPAQGASTSVPL